MPNLLLLCNRKSHSRSLYYLLQWTPSGQNFGASTICEQLGEALIFAVRTEYLQFGLNRVRCVIWTPLFSTWLLIPTWINSLSLYLSRVLSRLFILIFIKIVILRNWFRRIADQRCIFDQLNVFFKFHILVWFLRLVNRIANRLYSFGSNEIFKGRGGV